jgi:hypothetical protein
MTAKLPQHTLLTGATFSTFVHAHRFVVVHFWAVWNRYDTMMRKVIDSQIPGDLQAAIRYACVDVESPSTVELCRQHNVVNVPFLALYRDGVLTRRIVGMRSPDVMIQYFQELLAAP